MRDAFGGVFMARLLLVFIVIYVGFSAISLNYAKAFKVKNSVISFVEEKQILDLNAFFSRGDNTYVQELGNILASTGYNKTCRNGNGVIDTGPGGRPKYCYNGVVIAEQERDANHIDYLIRTYAGWDVSILNMILALGGNDTSSSAVIGGTWEIRGNAIVRLRVPSGQSTEHSDTPAQGCSNEYPYATIDDCINAYARLNGLNADNDDDYTIATGHCHQGWGTADTTRYIACWRID